MSYPGVDNVQLCQFIDNDMNVKELPRVHRKACYACALKEAQEQARRERVHANDSGVMSSLLGKFADSLFFTETSQNKERGLSNKRSLLLFATSWWAAPMTIFILVVVSVDRVYGIPSGGSLGIQKDAGVLQILVLVALPVLAAGICTMLSVQANSTMKRGNKKIKELNAEELGALKSDLLSEDVQAHVLTNKNEYAKVLSRAIQIRSISYDKSDGSDGGNQSTDLNTFLELHKLLRESFSILHQKYPPIIINKYSLLFKIPGTNPSLAPILLCSHLDVVPASDGIWDNDPFSGNIIDGVIWGRGAIDNKHNVVGQLAAVEYLLSTNTSLERTIYIGMGHDEEIGGVDGAAHIAKYLVEKERVRLECVLDEGTMMVAGAIPGYKPHLAMIGVSEKGHMSVELSVKGPGGHASMPPIDSESPMKIMAQAIAKLESNPLPPHFERGAVFRTELEFIAEKLKFPLNLICSNFWLFGGLMKSILIRANNGAAASVRTTTAVTKIQGGTKVNTLPHEVKAYVNHRVEPSDTIESVLEYDRKLVNDDRVKMRVLEGAIPPSPTSSFTSDPFRHIQQCVQLVFGLDSVPALCIGNTDTRWYWSLSDNIFRFSPLALTLKETSMFHGLNERISVDALAGIVQFYISFIKMSCGPSKD
eukprot:scaffold7494_cov55-Attheya_sp.AAC.1